MSKYSKPVPNDPLKNSKMLIEDTDSKSTKNSKMLVEDTDSKSTKNSKMLVTNTGTNSTKNKHNFDTNAVIEHNTEKNTAHTKNKTASVKKSPSSKKKHTGFWIAVVIAIIVLLAITDPFSNENPSDIINNNQQSSSSSNNFINGLSNDQNQNDPLSNGSSSNFGTTDEPTTNQRSLNITEENYGNLNIPGIYIGKTTTIIEEPIVSTSGYFANNGESHTYTYTAPRDGLYRFDLNDVNANASLRISIKDSDNNFVTSSSSLGTYATLSAKKTYIIETSCYRGPTGYTLNIGVQKASTDISNTTTLHDQIAFENQENLYTFIAPRTGRYRFELTEVNANTRITMQMWDKLDNLVMTDSSHGSSVELKAGEVYRLKAKQYRNLGSYTMRIYFPKESTNITGYGIINDKVEFNDQINAYTFTAPHTGKYHFNLTETNANVRISMQMWDKLDNLVMSNSSHGASVELKAGETYRLHIKQYREKGSYKLLVGYQKKSVDISKYDIVYDSVTYEGQQNIYYFTPSETRKYQFTIANPQSNCYFLISTYDEHENTVFTTRSTTTQASLEANKTYKIQIQQSTGYDSYSLSIQ